MPEVPSRATGVYESSRSGEPLRQGEIISAVVQHVLNLDKLKSGEAQIDPKTHNYVVILSQECDLHNDFGRPADKQQLPNVLLCSARSAELVRPDVGGSDVWKRVRQNQDERYQFLQAVSKEEDAGALGLPELCVDFKRYFTVPVDEMYFQVSRWAQRRCVLTTPYKDHLCTRFANFQCRIALPSEHFSEP